MEPASHSDINGNESSKDSPASPLAADAAAALSFLEMLYATQHAGVLATAGFPGPRTEFFDLSQPAPLERAAEYGISLAASRDVYFGVGIHGQRPAQGRGKAEGVIAIPGLWTDLDILHPVHAETKLPPDEEAALEILSEFGTPPTVTVRSGHGLQLHWLFTEPWQRDDDEWTKRAHQHAIRLQEVLRTISGTRGFRAGRDGRPGEDLTIARNTEPQRPRGRETRHI